MSNKGHDNLIPQAHVLTVDEQSAGGRRSAEVRRERRKAKDTLNILLGLPVKAGSVTDPDELKSIKDKSNTDCNTSILVNLVKSALDGDTNAVRMIYTLTGEYSTRTQIEADIPADESLRRMAQDMKYGIFERQADSVYNHVDHRQQGRMFEWWCNSDNADYMVHHFTRSELEQIEYTFINANEWQKIDFVHKVLTTDKIPNEDALLLFDTKYLPIVKKRFSNPQEPQTLAELFERRNTELTDSFTD